MARKKDSKALFEVLSKTESTMSVPDWMKPKPVVDETSPATETASSEESQESEPTPPAEEPTPEPVDETPPAEVEEPPAEEMIEEDTAEAEDTAEEELVEEAPDEELDAEVEDDSDAGETTEYEEPEDVEEIDELAEEDFSEEPLDEVEEDAVFEDEAESFEDVENAEEPAPAPAKAGLRWKDLFGSSGAARQAPFALRPRSAVILIAVVGGLILLAFLLGRVTNMNRETPDTPQAETPSAQTPTPAQTAEQRPVVVTDAPEASVSGQRNPDRYFLIIETLRGNGDADKAEAERIIQFCKANGIPADMVELQRGNTPCVAVWSLLGFRFANSQPALEHVRKVEEVGGAYFEKYQTYKFQQRRRRDGSLRPFFVAGKAEQPAG